MEVSNIKHIQNYIEKVAPPVISMNERINLIAKFFDNISIFNLIMFGLGITSLFILTYILYIMLTT